MHFRALIVAATTATTSPAFSQQIAQLSPDEVAMVVGTFIVQSQNCDLKPKMDFPMNVAVANLGQDVVDYLPDARYAPLVQVKSNKAKEYMAGMGKTQACAAMEEILRKYLPDLYP